MEEAHVHPMSSRKPLEYLEWLDADERLPVWRARAREFLVGPWRENLLAPFPGCRLAPATASREGGDA